MRVLIAAMLIAPLMLAGISPAMAASGIQVASDDDGKAERSSYSAQARNELSEWRQKLQATASKGKAEGKEASAAVMTELDKAWDKADTACHRLEVAGSADWDTTKAAFQASTHELAETWHRTFPANK